jgi:hypothetical protein
MGQLHAATVDAYEGERVRTGAPLDDLAGHPGQGPVHRPLVQELLSVCCHFRA